MGLDARKYQTKYFGFIVSAIFAVLAAYVLGTGAPHARDAVLVQLCGFFILATLEMFTVDDEGRLPAWIYGCGFMMLLVCIIMHAILLTTKTTALARAYAISVVATNSVLLVLGSIGVCVGDNSKIMY